MTSLERTADATMRVVRHVPLMGELLWGAWQVRQALRDQQAAEEMADLEWVRGLGDSTEVARNRPQSDEQPATVSEQGRAKKRTKWNDPKGAA